MPPTTKLIVKILGDFLQVGNNVVLNPRHIISIEWCTLAGTGQGSGYKIVIYCVHRNSNTWKVKTKEERDDLFERIGNALELMGCQGPEPKWEPGNDPVMERMEDLEYVEPGEEETQTVEKLQKRLNQTLEMARRALAGRDLECQNCGAIGDAPGMFLPKLGSD